MRQQNENLEPQRRAGFYELDLYNFRASIGAVLDYLDKVDPEAAAVARALPVRLLAHPPGAVTGTAGTALLRLRSAMA